MRDRGVPLWHERSPAVAAPLHGPVALPGLRSRRWDVVVVGLGATGLTAAVHLATRGAAVLGLDAVGVGGGAAGANGGFLLGGLAAFHHDAVRRYGRATASAWYRRTLDELARTLAEEPSARRTGSLRSAADALEHRDLRVQRAALRADGIAVDEVAGPLGPALLLPDDAAFDPMARCRRLAADAVAAGATLVEGVRVVVHGDASVVGGERVAAAVTLVAVDGGLESAVPALAGRVTSVRLQMLGTASVGATVLERPTYHRWGHDYLQQLPGGALAVGGGRDLEEEDARGGDDQPTGVVQRHLEELLATVVGDHPVPAVTHRWAARSGYTDDLLPIDEWLAPTVRVLGGYSGHGNLVGPMLAREAADELLEAAAR